MADATPRRRPPAAGRQPAHEQGFLRWIELTDDTPTNGYPFNLPVVQAIRAAGQIDLHSQVTFLVGENGTGKSTLIEALAVACGFNPEGGSHSFRFATRASESALGQYLRVVKAVRKPKTGFFLRAESFYNVATEVERLDREPYSPPLLPAYGGVSLHERSHGESFLSLAMHRFRPNGLYILDEPEAALSVHGCLALLARIAQLAAAGSQFVIATHSPVLIALPSALILQIGGDGDIAPAAFDDAGPVTLMRAFLTDPQPFLRHLIPDTTG